MKTTIRRFSTLLPVFAGLCISSISHADDKTPTAPADPGWPREFTADKKTLTVYQPQIDKWTDYTSMHLRCAIEVEGVLKEPKFGVAEIDAATLVDQETRLVKVYAIKREIRFNGVTDAEQESLRAAVNLLSPPERIITVSLDRVITCLDPENSNVQKAVDVSLDPPPIFYSNKPAVLVIFMGEPQFKPVVPTDPDLMFALNTNWDVFYQPSTKSFYLLNNDHWLTAKSTEDVWTVATELPEKLSKLPDDDNWSEIRKHIPAKKAAVAEHVISSKQPAELLITTGDPEYKPIPGTKLLEVTNTESLLMLDSAGGKFYYQVAGRWFRAPKLDGKWEAASSSLPEDFKKIPDEHPLAFVKATVPGTDEAKDAVMLASVPQSTHVERSNIPKLEVTYKGEPVFKTISPTQVQYAVNSPYSVFIVDNGYYCCDQGVWFTAKSAKGPWSWCTEVPAEIYKIPVTSPAHNVTYVTVKESTPETVVYNQTSGYSGEYVAANGVLMFGAGLIIGALINDHHDHYIYPPAPWYSYGCGAVYHYGYGGYYGAAGRVYGPYGGAGYVAAYNPATGIYSRGAYAYGPYGSAGYRQAYNPRTGTYAQAGYRATPHGSVSGGRVYNPYTGASAAAGRVSNEYGSAGRASAYNPVTGKGATGGYVSGDKGTVAGGRTNQGSGAIKWDTENGQGAVVKTKNDNIYAAHDGTVYKKDSNGNWTSNSGSGWESAASTKPQSGTQNTTKPQTTKPQTTAKPQPTNTQSLDSMARSRERGTTQTQRTQTFQRSAPSGGARSGGGGRRR
jgi:hypothetical protein